MKGNAIGPDQGQRKKKQIGDKISFLFFIYRIQRMQIMYHLTDSSQQPSEVSLVISPILQRRKLKHREVPCLAVVVS